MEVVETERLVLRHFTPDDAAFILELLNEPGWKQYIGDRGVDSRPFFHPAHLLPPYATGARLPVAEHLGSRGINLPSGTGLERDQVERVARALAEALGA